jgi:phage terminase large subunit-like protein
VIDVAIDPAAFADAHLPLNEKGQPWTLSSHQRRVLARMFRRAFRLRVWSEPKKSGKTFIAALLVLWWAFTHAHTEIILAANDAEQSQGRVFKTVADLLKANPALGASATILSAEIRLSNGTPIMAIAGDYKGAAGSRHSLYMIDEPAGIMEERAVRLVEELTPPPSEPDAWGLITGTAGWIGESKMWEALYQRGLAGERVDDDLELYEADDLVMFWSHTPRQPWQTAEYYVAQRRSLRPATFSRLHENMWVSSESSAIDAALWDSNVYEQHAAMLPSQEMLLIGGLDAAPKSDTSACVWVARDDDLVVLVQHRIWSPKGQPLDFAVIDEYVRWMHAHFRIAKLVMDPYQLHSLLTRWQQDGIPAEEFPQTSANLTRATETLLDLLRSRRLAVYPDAEMRQQALNAVLIESPRGVRLAKTTHAKKIDSLVALSMACSVCVETPVSEPARLW